MYDVLSIIEDIENLSIIVNKSKLPKQARLIAPAGSTPVTHIQPTRRHLCYWPREGGCLQSMHADKEVFITWALYVLKYSPEFMSINSIECVYIYIYICVHITYVYIHIYIHINTRYS